MRFFLFLLLFSFSGLGFSQQAEEVQQNQISEAPVPLNFNEEKTKRYKEDPAFDYSEAVEGDSWWTKFKRYVRLQWQRFLDWLFGDYSPPLLLAIFLDILPYLLLGMLLTFILYLFSRLNPAAGLLGSSEKAEIHFDDEEKIVKSRNIPELIKKAVAEENYRLAVRYHFLYILQQLSQNGYVNYDSSKTDEDYLAELKNEDLKAHFRKVNRIYDFIWYGNFEITADDYERFRQAFQKMESSIASPHEQNL